MNFFGRISERDPFKTLWQARDHKCWSFFCPLCRATRKVSLKPRPAARHYAQLGLTAVALMLAGWSFWEWKGIVSIFPLWIGFELIYRMRARAHLNCPHCGFDPYLYLVDVKRAREEIDSHWRKKFAEKGIPFPEKNQPARAPSRTVAGAQAPVALPEASETESGPQMPA